jgi:hypothetical protein
VIRIAKLHSAVSRFCTFIMTVKYLSSRREIQTRSDLTFNITATYQYENMYHEIWAKNIKEK